MLRHAILPLGGVLVQTFKHRAAFFVLAATVGLAGCESNPFVRSGEPQGGAQVDETALSAQACPEPVIVEPICPEPEERIVERVIERTFEKVVEVPVAKNKMVLGSVEFFELNPGELHLKARVDTGAATTSLSALDLAIFERDGDKWVRFHMPNPKGGIPIEVELPVERFVRIKRHGFDSQRRPVVLMNVTVGDRTHLIEVNLTDRSGFDYSLLIGRNFLKDNAVVDVSRKYLAGKAM